MFHSRLPLFLVVLAIMCLMMSFNQYHLVSAQEENQTTPSDLLPSILLDAVINHDISSIDRALSSGESIDLTNDRGWSAARFAVAVGDMDILRELIARGIDLNQADHDGITPLMAAAGAGDKEMVEILLAGNASPLQTTADGVDAYRTAVDAGRQLVALMIAESAATHAIDSEDGEALIAALRRGAYVNIRNGAGWTPAIFATSRGDIDLVNQVLSFGPDLNRSENDGWTALHFAANAGSAPLVQLLLTHNADRFVRNLADKTPRDLAIEQNHLEVVDLLPDNDEL